MQDNSLAKALAMAAQLGFAVACPLLAFIAGGVWLDGRFNTSPWLFFIGLLLGVLAAGGALFQVSGAQSRSVRRSMQRKAVPYKVESPEEEAGTPRANKGPHDGL
jgi:F0F1-type ATP synthase assembly protein I